MSGLAARCAFTEQMESHRFLIVHTLPAENLDFAWDRPETAATLRAKLAAEASPDWPRTAAWLLREARVDQVWPFLSLRQIADCFEQLRPLLGRRRPLWGYLLRAGHELGRL